MAETLTLKDMQRHLIKTIMGSVITSVILAIGTGVIFYFKTNAAIDTLNTNQNEMKKTLDSHTEQINKNNTGMGMNEVQQAAFEKRLTSIEESQKQILQVLIEIRTNSNK